MSSRSNSKWSIVLGTAATEGSTACVKGPLRSQVSLRTISMSERTLAAANISKQQVHKRHGFNAIAIATNRSQTPTLSGMDCQKFSRRELLFAPRMFLNLT